MGTKPGQRWDQKKAVPRLKKRGVHSQEGGGKRNKDRDREQAERKGQRGHRERQPERTEKRIKKVSKSWRERRGGEKGTRVPTFMGTHKHSFIFCCICIWTRIGADPENHESTSRETLSDRGRRGKGDGNRKASGSHIHKMPL